MALTVRYASSAGGGAHDGTTEADAWSFAEMLTNAAAGQIVNFKGNHTLTGAASFTNNGTATSPIKVRGYASAAGDGYQGRTNSNGPLVTTNFSVWTCGTNEVNGSAKNYIIYEAIQFLSSRNGNAILAGEDCLFARCAFENSSTNAGASCVAAPFGRAYFYDCDIAMTGASGGSAALEVSGNGLGIIACRVAGGTARCVLISGTSHIMILGSVLIKGATGGIVTDAAGSRYTVFGTTIVGNSGSGAVLGDGLVGLNGFFNCLFTDHGAYGLNFFDDDIPTILGGNRYDRNTSGAKTGASDWREGTSWSEDTTSATQGNEYEDYASNDFRLKSGSPAREIAVWPFRDIGAVQHEDSGGAGGGGSLARANAGLGAIS